MRPVRRSRVPSTVFACALAALLAPAAQRGACGQDGEGPAPGRVRGVVYEDANRNGVRDPGERPLAGVLVSNQVEVVRTDAEGRYDLAIDDDTMVFVIQPAGFAAPVDARNVPRFSYNHKPGGSPKLRFPGVSPTGPLPASVDFALVPEEQPERFRMVCFGDPQPRNRRELGYFVRDLLEPIRDDFFEHGGLTPRFGVSLGDLVFDDLSLLEPLSRAMSAVGIPWYSVIGNHDLNFDAPDHRRADETYERVYGPPCFAWQHAKVWFVALNTVLWHPKQGRQDAHYTAGIDERQMRFLASLLPEIPEDHLVVLLMHIPLSGVANRDEVFRLLEKRPHTLSLSAHQHYHQHVFLGAEHGWRGEKPHHLVIHGTACGDWWHGAPDEQGIPHATMRDGTPNGYSLIDFDGAAYTIRYRAARRPPEEQMAIDAPARIKRDSLDDRWVYVNVYNGSERTRVSMRVGEQGAWTPLERTRAWDPLYARARQREEGHLPEDYRPLSGPMDSSHLWRGKLPEGTPPGTHVIEVRAVEADGQSAAGRRVIEVTE